MFVVLLLLLTAGCGATRPVKYYQLQVPQSAPAAAANPLPISLLLGRVTAPRLYRGDRIVYSLGPQQMGTYEYHRWVEPPDSMVETALVDLLRASGQYSSVQRVSSNAHGDYILRGHLISLEEVDKPSLAARFAMNLELFYPKTGTTVWSQSYSQDEPVTSGNSKKKKVDVADVVSALNRNVQQGLLQLTTSLGQYFANHPAQ
jgi:ABC-type uncharacterized transport system auxiliary subunit